MINRDSSAIVLSNETIHGEGIPSADQIERVSSILEIVLPTFIHDLLGPISSAHSAATMLKFDLHEAKETQLEKEVQDLVNILEEYDSEIQLLILLKNSFSRTREFVNESPTTDRIPGYLQKILRFLNKRGERLGIVLEGIESAVLELQTIYSLETISKEETLPLMDVLVEQVRKTGPIVHDFTMIAESLLRPKSEITEGVEELTKWMYFRLDSHLRNLHKLRIQTIEEGYDYSRQVSPFIKFIFHEVIHNARKYGNGQSVDVFLSQSEGDFCIVIHDHGIGISQEEIDKVFERDFRSDSKAVNKIAGTGNGLANVRLQVEFLNGELTVESQELIGLLSDLVLFNYPELEALTQDNLRYIAGKIFSRSGNQVGEKAGVVTAAEVIAIQQGIEIFSDIEVLPEEIIALPSGTRFTIRVPMSQGQLVEV